jgi:hypothetical protein
MFIYINPQQVGKEIAYMRYEKTLDYLTAVKDILNFHAQQLQSDELLAASIYAQESIPYMEKCWNIAKKYSETFDESKHPIRFSDGTSLVTVIAQLEHAPITDLRVSISSIYFNLHEQYKKDKQRGYKLLSSSLKQTCLALCKTNRSIHEHLNMTGNE